MEPGLAAPKTITLDLRRPGDDPLRVFLVDDSSLVRTGLIQTFREHGGLHLVGTAWDGSSAWAACLDVGLHAVIVNASCRSIDVPGLIRKATQHGKGVAAKILLLANDADDAVCSQATTMGVGGVVLAREAPNVLVSALRIIASGYRISAPTQRLGRGKAGQVPPVPQSALDLLTGREHEVLLLMTQGLKNSEIAGKLVITESTVKTHVQNLLVKLGLRNRASAVAVAYELGITRAPRLSGR